LRAVILKNGVYNLLSTSDASLSPTRRNFGTKFLAPSFSLFNEYTTQTKGPPCSAEIFSSIHLPISVISAEDYEHDGPVIRSENIFNHSIKWDGVMVAHDEKTHASQCCVIFIYFNNLIFDNQK